MAITLNSDLIIYNQLVQTGYLERIQDVLALFNASSRGALVMRNEGIEGDFSKRAIYKIGGSVAHRNVNSNAGVTPASIGADERIGVKCPWKYGPYATTEEAFKRRARSLEEFSMLLGQDLADAAMAYQITAAFAALQGAFEANSAGVIVAGNWATDGKKVLTKGMRLLGDRAERIAIWAMNSTEYFDLVDNAITEKLDGEIGITVYGGVPGTLGKPVLVSDKIPAGAIYGLQPGAVELVESQAPGFRSYNIDDAENLAVGYRAEGVFNLEVLGYKWDVDSTAPANPNNTQLATAANWAKYATSDKATAGVMIDLSGT